MGTSHLGHWWPQHGRSLHCPLLTFWLVLIDFFFFRSHCAKSSFQNKSSTTQFPVQELGPGWGSKHHISHCTQVWEFYEPLPLPDKFTVCTSSDEGSAEGMGAGLPLVLSLWPALPVSVGLPPISAVVAHCGRGTVLTHPRPPCLALHSLGGLDALLEGPRAALQQALRSCLGPKWPGLSLLDSREAGPKAGCG